MFAFRTLGFVSLVFEPWRMYWQMEKKLKKKYPLPKRPSILAELNAEPNVSPRCILIQPRGLNIQMAKTILQGSSQDLLAMADVFRCSRPPKARRHKMNWPQVVNTVVGSLICSSSHGGDRVFSDSSHDDGKERTNSFSSNVVHSVSLECWG